MARKVRHLTLDKLTVNPGLARRLSPGVAFRYHALPVAEENGHITVAMADPEDTLARDAVVSALGTPLCAVRGDTGLIDALLAEVWPDRLERSLHLLACTHASPTADQVLAFAEALGDLLQTQINYVRTETQTCEALVQEVEQGHYDLLIWGEGGSDQTLSERLFSGPVYRKVKDNITCSLLVVRGPQWPLQRILLVVSGGDHVALDWVVRLARPSGAVVTVLAVVPPAPAMYSGFARMQQGLDTLLTTNAALGRQMRRLARWLVDWEVEAKLRLRQGTPDQEIRREVFEGNYNLIVMVDQPRGWWRRWLVTDRIASLLDWVERPVLVAKPTIV